MITVSINKICRHKYFNKFYMTDLEKMHNYLEQVTRSFKSWFKFLSIYLYINEQSRFTLLDLNKKMIEFDLGYKGDDAYIDQNNEKFEFQYPLYKNLPKGFTTDNGLEQNPKVLIRNTNNLSHENDKKISFSKNESIQKEKEYLNSSIYIDLFKNIKENGAATLNRINFLFI